MIFTHQLSIGEILFQSFVYNYLKQTSQNPQYFPSVAAVVLHFTSLNLYS